MKSFSYTELDKLAGEVLPERAVLSTLLVGGGSDNDNSNLNFNHGGGGHGGGTTAVVPNCQAINNNPQGGLIGALGLSSNNPTSSFTCASSSVVSGH
ncbi:MULTISPECIES: hypothetical protein [Actinomadura]|uniref:Uncharacterized protein n=3 Tax=Actinomadura TaxID=1988 RepID=A0A5D0NR99_9ACTN|nr:MULTISPECIES: hypothetical protein [Actinomadura]TYB46812.1 hypothetical protein FXF69_16655 [Actinomadura chibensis]TYC13902.1 hypothetical protein FXF65_19860 [Actinomadura syzygii]TYK49024.1 hypothetical protein FXF68_14410 [Actinomadura decatromicini]